MVYKCKVCAVDIHPKRVELGYKDYCVNHSKESKYSAHVVSEGNDVADLINSIQVIKDNLIAADLKRLNKVKIL
jgi:hypothetical protein